MIRLERHVFGSIDGYRTLARSPGLSDSDCRAIELYQFGNPDRGFIDALSAAPSYVSRPLGQDRRVITRVLPGPADDQGRKTLRFVSVILRAGHWAQLNCDVVSLLKNKPIWAWSGGSSIDCVDVSPAGNPPKFDTSRAAKILTLISLIENNWGRGDGVRVRASEYRLMDMAAIEALLPPDVSKRISVGHQVLNPTLRLGVMTVPDRAVASSQVLISARPPELSPFAQALTVAGVAKGTTPRSFIQRYELFGTGTKPPRHSVTPKAPSLQSQPAPPMEEPMNRRRVMFASLSIILALIVGIVAGVFLGGAGVSSDDWKKIVVRAIDLPADPTLLGASLNTFESELRSGPLAERSELDDVLSALQRRKEASQAVSERFEDGQGTLMQSYNRTKAALTQMEMEVDTAYRAVAQLEQSLAALADQPFDERNLEELEQLKTQFSDIPRFQDLVGRMIEELASVAMSFDSRTDLDGDATGASGDGRRPNTTDEPTASEEDAESDEGEADDDEADEYSSLSTGATP